MIYILKFIAAFLLPPGLFVLLGIILSVYLWRRRQNIGRFAFSLSAFLTLLLYFSSTFLGAKLLGQHSEVTSPVQQFGTYFVDGVVFFLEMHIGIVA